MADSNTGMDFEILACPSCGSKNAVYHKDLHKTLKCRKCGQRFTKEQAEKAAPQKTKRAIQKVENLTGRQLGHFKLLGVLGSGAMGVVYRAQDTMLMRDVAVKVLPKDMAEKDPKGLERFLNEARTAAQLVHPNVVQIFHIAQAEGTYFIAMEYVRGGTAERAAHLRGGRLDPQFAFEKMLETADAMAMAHKRKIFHRDLKPANLLLTTEGMIKVADFGLALWTENPDGTMTAATPHIVGTPQYMSPEQARGNSGESPSDIYSLAATFYRLVVGQPPFKASNAMGYFQAHINQPVPDPRDELPDLNADMAELLMKCLSKTPEERPSAQAVASSIRERLGSRGSFSMGFNPIESGSMSMSAGEQSVSMSTLNTVQGDSGGLSQTFASQNNYLSLFGLGNYPFNDVRNQNAFWIGGPHQAVVESLSTQVQMGCSPVLLTGPAGSGRTFVATIVQSNVGSVKTFTVQPRLLAGQSMLIALARMVGSSLDGGPNELIHNFLEKAQDPDDPDRRTLITVDEVKPEASELLNDIRTFCEVTAEHPNVTLLLVGPQDMPMLLGQHGVPLDLRGETEPADVRPLRLEEMNEYIDFRVAKVGRSNTQLVFTPSARQLLHKRSGGLPRLVNIYCHNALTLAAHTKQDHINTPLMWRAMQKKSYVTNVEALPPLGKQDSDAWQRLELLRALDLVRAPSTTSASVPITG